jgi:hypothetical protein
MHIPNFNLSKPFWKFWINVLFIFECLLMYLGIFQIIKIFFTLLHKMNSLLLNFWFYSLKFFSRNVWHMVYCYDTMKVWKKSIWENRVVCNRPCMMHRQTLWKIQMQVPKWKQWKKKDLRCVFSFVALWG